MTALLLWFVAAFVFGWLIGRGYGPMMFKIATMPLRLVLKRR